LLEDYKHILHTNPKMIGFKALKKTKQKSNWYGKRLSLLEDYKHILHTNPKMTGFKAVKKPATIVEASLCNHG
jgi:hypothetical protein